jgi:uncharacterized membrane protein
MAEGGARSTEVHDRREQEVEFSRVVAFSDGVFAIAITLLVLGLEVPSHVPDLGQALRDRADDLYAYALSLAVLGSLWLSHHRFYGSLARFDSRLIAINLAYLAFVALVPFTSDLLGDYSGKTSAVVIYALVMAAISITFGVQIRYAFRHGLVRADTQPDERRYAGRGSIVISVGFLSSIAVAFLSVEVATYMWIAVAFLGGRIADALAGRRFPF